VHLKFYVVFMGSFVCTGNVLDLPIVGVGRCALAHVGRERRAGLVVVEGTGVPV
jgi:hypothetical protein